MQKVTVKINIFFKMDRDKRIDFPPSAFEETVPLSHTVLRNSGKAVPTLKRVG